MKKPDPDLMSECAQEFAEAVTRTHGSRQEVADTMVALAIAYAAQSDISTEEMRRYVAYFVRKRYPRANPALATLHEHRRPE